MHLDSIMTQAYPVFMRQGSGKSARAAYKCFIHNAQERK